MVKYANYVYYYTEIILRTVLRILRNDLSFLRKINISITLICPRIERTKYENAL